MIQIYDSKSGKKVPFEPLKKGEVSMYVCGPTVYDVAHLGHGRSAVNFDVIRKYFKYRGFKVKFVSNYTDIDDKMINRAKEEGISVEELAKKIIPEYEKDYASLGITPPDVLPKATEHVPEIINLIKYLEEKKCTYVLDDGVYFDVTKFPNYGKLSGQNLEDLQMGARVDVNENKKNPYDFVLWKFKKEGEPSWKSPWGEGRPGWHIECSAMTWKHLGEKFDIHGGGLDLKFPHHECEIAQSVCAFGKGSFAQYWLHNGFIQIDNEKMSKSLGNFFTLKDIFKKYDPQVVRLMFLQTHYRNPINFSEKLLEQSKAGLEKIHDFIRKLEENYASLISYKNLEKDFDHLKISFVNEIQKFDEAMNNDFDTSGALSVVFDLIKRGNGLLVEMDVFSREDADEILKFLKTIDEILGIIFRTSTEKIPDNITKLAEKRLQARKNKDFKTADKLRDEIAEKGYTVEDTPDGYVLKK